MWNCDNGLSRFSFKNVCSFHYLSIILNILILFLLNVILWFIYFKKVQGWLGFPNLWSGQKPWWNWCLTSVVNFCEFRRIELAKSTLLTSMLVPLGSFQIFWGVQMLKREWGAESNGKLPHLSIPVKLLPGFLSLRWKTCLWAEQRPWFLSLQWRTYPWAEHSDDDDDGDDLFYGDLESSVSPTLKQCFGLCSQHFLRN